MIDITCTSCRTLLTIDDAFAGGVCRCQHCGTIQTVPSNLKPSTRPRSPTGGAIPASRSIYQKRAHSDAGTGLDDLASAVASSGLRAGHLSKSPTTVATAQAGTATVVKKKVPVLWLVLAGVLVLALTIVVVILLMSSHSGTPPKASDNSPVSGVAGAATPATPATPENTTSSPENTASPPIGPSFCGVPLADPSVVYILDRGAASGQYFDGMKAALYRSLELIGPTRQFAVILCDNDTSPVVFPPKGLANADAPTIASLHNVLDDVVATGSTRLASAVTGAVGRSPSVIIIVTGKYSLASDDINVLKQNAQHGIRFDTFVIGDVPSADDFQDIASRSGGIFRKLSESDLRQFGQ